MLIQIRWVLFQIMGSFLYRTKVSLHAFSCLVLNRLTYHFVQLYASLNWVFSARMYILISIRPERHLVSAERPDSKGIDLRFLSVDVCVCFIANRRRTGLSEPLRAQLVVCLRPLLERRSRLFAQCWTAWLNLAWIDKCSIALSHKCLLPRRPCIERRPCRVELPIW